MNFLLQPKKSTGLMVDDGSRAIMTKTIAFFARTEQPSPDVSERLIMSLLYLGPTSEFKWFKLAFTSKNAPPILVGESDVKSFESSEVINYLKLFTSPGYTALLDSNTLHEPYNKVFMVIIPQPNGALSNHIYETILIKTDMLYDGFRLRPVMHPIENQLESPLFYSDEHSVFFISAEERIQYFSSYPGYYWNVESSVLLPDDKIEIPPLYEEPVVIDPSGPIINPLNEYFNPYYKQTIANNNAFVYRDTTFDASGILTKENVI